MCRATTVAVLLAVNLAIVFCDTSLWYTSLPVLPVLVASSEHIPDQLCRNHSRLFLRSLDNYTLWAMQMLDSSAKLPGGVLEGDVDQLGHFDECLAVSSGEVRGQYCLLELSFQLPDYPPPDTTPDPFGLDFPPHLHFWEKIKASLTDRSKVSRDTLHWGLCLPASCTAASLQHTLDHEARALFSRTGLQVTARASATRCTVDSIPPPLSLGETAFCAVVAALVLAVTASSWYDYSYCDVDSKPEEGSKAVSMLLCFSVRRTLRGLAKVVRYQPALDAMDGLRFFFMALVISGHRLSMYNSMPTLDALKYEQLFHRFGNGFLLNGTLLVDFFFLVSSSLLSYHLTLNIHKVGGLQLLLIFLTRLVRLTPSYMLVVFLHATVLYRTGSGPLWQEVVGLDQRRCANSWWTNMLYVNNYVMVDQMCMFQSWYLSADTQMFAISLVLILSIHRWPVLGYSAATVLALASVAVPFFTTWWTRADGFLIPFVEVTDDVISSRYFQDIYVRTENRMAPCLVGLSLGWILCRTSKSSFRISKLQTMALYAAMLALLTSSFVLSYFFHKPGLPYDVVRAGVYAALSRLGLAVSFGGMAVAATFGEWKLLQKVFSWSPLRAVSRLTYGAYLVHTVGQLYDKGSRKVSQQADIFSGCFTILADLTFSYGLSFFLMILVESPIRSLEKIVFRRGGSGSS